MAPRKLKPDEEALVKKWVPWMFYFMKMMRRANIYLIPIPREESKMAYEKVCNSGFVAGGEWDKPRDPNRKNSWQPKPQDREAYVKYMKDVIDRHPLTSTYNAMMVFFAANAGSACVDNIVCLYNSSPAQKKYWSEVHKLNKADLQEVKKNGVLMNRSNPPNDIPLRDPNERPINMPFVRSREMHSGIKVSINNWGQYEKIGQTFFTQDDDERGGYAVFELAGVLLLETGKFYKIRYEDNVDSIQITERELSAMIRDGLWV